MLGLAVATVIFMLCAYSLGQTRGPRWRIRGALVFVIGLAVAAVLLTPLEFAK